MHTVRIKKLNEKAIIPVWNNKSAGCDLSSTEDIILLPRERHLFKTGLSIEIPPGLYGRIAPRSGLAFNFGIDTLAGVIDEDYRGEIGVILINLGKEPKNIIAGEKIAQLIFENYTRINFTEADILTNTERGAGRYGSTDKKIVTPTAVEPVAKPKNEGFVLGRRTTVEAWPESDEAKFHLRRHDGYIYEYTENGSRGLCVVDSSGQVLGKYSFKR